MRASKSLLFQGCVLGCLLSLLLINTLTTPQVAASTWHVRADALAPGNGSPESPFEQIQSAAYAAAAGDTVLVHGGTYYETVKTSRSGVADSTGVIRYIYFLAAGDGPAIIKAQSNYCFLVDTSDDYIWIEGFYLTRAYAVSAVHGAAIRTFGNYGVFINNYMYDNGIGVFCEGNGGYAEFNNNRGNYIAHNVISESIEAGVRLKHSSENVIAFNLFYDNNLNEPCGAVTFYCGVGNRILNNTFWDNRAWAVAVYNGSNPDSCIACSNSEVRDNIFARPDPGQLLQVQVKTAQDSSSSFSYNLFWSPDSSVPLVEWGTGQGAVGYLWTLDQYKYYAGQINPLDSAGVFYANPQFVNPWMHEFELLPGSPALDAGSLPAEEAPFGIGPETPLPFPPDNLHANQLTAEANQNLDVGPVDLGYHHYVNQYSLNPELIYHMGLNIYPNPYNGNGDLKFILPNVPYARNISGEIYDIQGRLVERFTIPDAPLNLFHLHWDTRLLASGNYYFIVDIDGQIMRQKVVLIK